MPSRHSETQLPDWLWFFLILPIVLIVAVLYRQRRLQPLLAQLREGKIPTKIPPPAPHYREPDSIPLPQDVKEVAVETAAKPDDLKVIEGIGPAIEALLLKVGITSYQQLSQTSLERLNQILEDAKLGSLTNPGTWPQQARLAAAGKWDELQAYQDTLSRGRPSELLQE